MTPAPVDLTKGLSELAHVIETEVLPTLERDVQQLAAVHERQELRRRVERERQESAEKSAGESREGR
jgi:hypothetical protein